MRYLFIFLFITLLTSCGDGLPKKAVFCDCINQKSETNDVREWSPGTPRNSSKFVPGWGDTIEEAKQVAKEKCELKGEDFVFYADTCDDNIVISRVVQ